jgi:hypothetical protein
MGKTTQMIRSCREQFAYSFGNILEMAAKDQGNRDQGPEDERNREGDISKYAVRLSHIWRADEWIYTRQLGGFD